MVVIFGESVTFLSPRQSLKAHTPSLSKEGGRFHHLNLFTLHKGCTSNGMEQRSLLKDEKLQLGALPWSTLPKDSDLFWKDKPDDEVVAPERIVLNFINVWRYDNKGNFRSDSAFVNERIVFTHSTQI